MPPLCYSQRQGRVWQSASMGPTVTTRYGAVRGQVRDGVASFLGIPYAASPVGGRRLQAPVPPEPWSGVRDAAAFGPTPPKPDYPRPFDTLRAEPSIPGDEWLSLNVSGLACMPPGSGSPGREILAGCLTFR